jgi:hypothetical protein
LPTQTSIARRESASVASNIYPHRTTLHREGVNLELPPPRCEVVIIGHCKAVDDVGRLNSRTTDQLYLRTDEAANREFRLSRAINNCRHDSGDSYRCVNSSNC